MIKKPSYIMKKKMAKIPRKKMLLGNNAGYI